MITIIDSIMGSGKTTWAINYMNAHPEDRFLYIPPYLPEQERIMEACPALEFKQPEERPTKSAHFHVLLREGKNIALTHSLFSRLKLSQAEKDFLKLYGYKLILDEVLDVVGKINIKIDDIEMMMGMGKFRIEGFERKVCWMHDKYDGQFENLKQQVKNGNTVQSKHGTLLWLFPEDMLRLLSDAYVLTYMFEGSYLKPYFEIFELEYRMAFIKNGELVYGRSDDRKIKAQIKGLMDIEQSKTRNQVGDEEKSLTKGWYEKEKKRGIRIIPLKNAFNFLHHVCKATQKDAMYTVYDEMIHGSGRRYKMPRYGDAAFVPCNSRSTNVHANRRFLAYLINLHTDPTIDEWFQEHGKVVNKDAIALASMLQWIWRSAIRNGERIRLYIPSWRMRKMLEGWLAGLPAGQIACTDDEKKERKMRIFTHRVVKREKGKKKDQIKKNSA